MATTEPKPNTSADQKGGAKQNPNAGPQYPEEPAINEQIERFAEGSKPHKKEKVQFTTGNESQGCYNGTWNGFLRDGVGEYNWTVGKRYFGGWKENFMEGSFGVLEWAEGVAQGQWHLDKLDGPDGFCQLKNGMKYRGQWKDGHPHGTGVLTFPGDGGTYEGTFKDGRLHGYGLRKYPDHSNYKGYWVENARHGRGTYVWDEGRLQYNGEWKDDLPNGAGEMRWVIFRSEVESESEKSGEGKQSVSKTGPYNIHVYEGEFRNGKRHGKGTYTWPNGTKIFGEWENDSLANQISSSFMGIRCDDLEDDLDVDGLPIDAE